jgi:hypothetical protein
MQRKGNSHMMLEWVQINMVIKGSSMEILQKIKSNIALWSSNSSTGHVSTGNEIGVLKRQLHLHIYGGMIHNSQEVEAT